MWLFAIIIAVPLIEIALFVTVGAWLGLWPTLAIVLGTALLGGAVIRRQGVQAVAQMRAAGPQAANPLSPLAHAALTVVAGVLLILPGFFTDTLGLLLLIPPLRRVLIAVLATRMRFQTMPQRPARDMPIDGEYIDLDSGRIDPPANRPSGWTRH
ncbi:FxsA family protein [Fertoebacter nigrum]|uniref:FxsA family protein n=1 Tax=Fertoeibacter niger TaxID=2656921 RepID=A0A8X8H1L1_9RHOB|nr:FxsA family protein [Fertoeibacter niger]NUB45340.1 FxsA family protein [Fertoeibacter niger]